MASLLLPRKLLEQGAEMPLLPLELLPELLPDVEPLEEPLDEVLLEDPLEDPLEEPLEEELVEEAPLDEELLEETPLDDDPLDDEPSNVAPLEALPPQADIETATTRANIGAAMGADNIRSNILSFPFISYPEPAGLAATIRHSADAAQRAFLSAFPDDAARRCIMRAESARHAGSGINPKGFSSPFSARTAPVFGKQDRTHGMNGGAITIIGQGVSIAGDIAFSGYLRVQGAVTGHITCANESPGTLVVHQSGEVTGDIHAPNVVVGGQVHGHIKADDSIEIHGGAVVTGDAEYRQIEIRNGGVIEGVLKPLVRPQTEQVHERRLATPESPDIEALDATGSHHRRSSDSFWMRHRLAITATLAAVAVYVFWPSGEPTPIEAEAPALAQLDPDRTTPTDAAPAKQQAVPVAAPVLQPAPVLTEPPRSASTRSDVTRNESPPAAPAAPSVSPPAKPTATQGKPAATPSRIISVTGMEANKPATIYFVTTRERVVLYQKRRETQGDGKRIELGRGAKKRLSIADDEVVRVAEGDNLDVYFQGRKLSNGIVRSGDWIAFVPLEPPKPAPRGTPVPSINVETSTVERSAQIPRSPAVTSSAVTSSPATSPSVTVPTPVARPSLQTAPAASLPPRAVEATTNNEAARPASQ